MFIYDIGGNLKDQRAGEAIAMLPQNRTMLIEQLTDDPPMQPEVVTGLKTIKDVFDYYKPEVEVAFQADDGSEPEEKLRFRGLDDFGPKGLIKQSAFLQNLESQKTNYQDFLRYLNNKILRSLLDNPEAKAAYIATLDAMLAELEEAIG